MTTKWLGLAALVAAGVVANTLDAQQPDVATLVSQLTRNSRWTCVAAVQVEGRVFHPQGMAKIGEDFFVSSVEVTEPTRRLDTVDAAGFDRTPGAGVGHLFRITAAGRIVADTIIGEGTMYHPGGVDYDGQSLWVPVAEYRPNSRSIVYRIDPATGRAETVLQVADHIGGVVLDTEAKTLHGISWGSRRFYRWPLPTTGTVAASVPRDNPSHYIDYQDCKFAGHHRMVCTGLAELDGGPTSPRAVLGGLDLVSLGDGRPLWQVPVHIRVESGRAVTQNPSWFEATPDGLRGYFVPDDDRGTIYVYQIRP